MNTNMTRLPLLLLPLCGFMGFSPVLAQTTQPSVSEVIDEVIVSASLIPTPVGQVGASVGLITQADLKAQQTVYLRDAVQKIAGISTYQSGGDGSTANIFMRGMTGKYNAVIIDGIQINDPVSQQAAWPHLTTQGLERVEILRGSHSVLYGSEAVGGVVSMFTAHGGDTAQELTLEAGNENFRLAGYQAKGTLGDLSYGVSLQHADTDGISSADENDGNVEADGYRYQGGNARLVWSPHEDWKLDLALRASEGRNDTDSGAPADVLGTYNKFENQAYRLDAEYDAGSIQHIFRISQTEDENLSISQFLPLLLTGARQMASYHTIVELTDTVQLLAGVETETEEYETPTESYEVDTEAAYLLIQAEPLTGVYATFAVRRDDNEKFGSFETYRMTLLARLNDKIQLRANSGTGFRSPSLFELLGKSVFCAAEMCGNTDLQPEESESWDIGMVMTPRAGLSFEAGLFEIQVENFIQYGNIVPSDLNDNCLAANSFPGFPATGCGKYIQSGGTSTSQGAEFIADWQINDRFHLTANYTQLDTKKANGDRDIRRPKHTVNLSLTGAVTQRLSATLSLFHARDTVDTNFNLFRDVPLDDYTLVDMTASYEVSENLKIHGRIKNVLDDEYQTALGFGTPDRSAYIGMRMGF